MNENREHEHALLQITAQYADEARTGQSPKLGEYLARYPHYADEIANFVAYFHTFEEDMAVEAPMQAPMEAPMEAPIQTSIEDYVAPQLLAEFHRAAEAAINHILREQEGTVFAQKTPLWQDPPSDLQRIAEAQGNYWLNEQHDR